MYNGVGTGEQGQLCDRWLPRARSRTMGTGGEGGADLVQRMPMLQDVQGCAAVVRVRVAVRRTNGTMAVVGSAVAGWSGELWELQCHPMEYCGSCKGDGGRPTCSANQSSMLLNSSTALAYRSSLAHLLDTHDSTHDSTLWVAGHRVPWLTLRTFWPWSRATTWVTTSHV